MSEIRKFRKLSFEDKVYAFCLIAREEISTTMILLWMETAKGSELSEEEVIIITKIFKKCKLIVDWGNHRKNNPIIESLGISPKEVNDIVAAAGAKKLKDFFS